MTANDSTDLYRFYDAEGRLLYVGISFSAVARASQHRAEKGWWQDVTRMDVEHFATRKDADDAETLAIQTEHPIHNVAKRTGSRSITKTGLVKQSTFVGRVFAFGMPDGSCPVGYVREAWEPDDVYPRPTLEVSLYSWLSGYFGHSIAYIDLVGGMNMLEADYVIEGDEKVFQMDPLADFQARWKKQHAAA